MPSLPTPTLDVQTQRRAILPIGVAPLGELLDCLRAPRQPAAGFDAAIPVWRLFRGATLLHQGDAARHVHVVRSGSLKCVRTLDDGYAQVTAFALAGDVIGLEALQPGRQPYAALALEDSTVFTLPARELEAWRHAHPGLDDALLHAASRQLAQSADMLQVMAPVSAEVRLARFLGWWSRRLAERGQSPNRLYLRMGRRDIASLMGVAHETVSRSFALLADWQLLRVDVREVEILDHAGLARFARSTRGIPEAPPGARDARRRALHDAQPLAA